MAKELSTDLPVEELQEQVDKLKSRLDNYGEINPMAVEAYDEGAATGSSRSSQSKGGTSRSRPPLPLMVNSRSSPFNTSRGRPTSSLTRNPVA